MSGHEQKILVSLAFIFYIVHLGKVLVTLYPDTIMIFCRNFAGTFALVSQIELWSRVLKCALKLHRIILVYMNFEAQKETIKEF